MNPRRFNFDKLNHTSVLIGSALWLALLVSPTFHTREHGSIELVLLLAVLVVAPLVLPLVAGASRLYRSAIVLQPWCAAFALASFFIAPGLGAAATSGAWLLWSSLVALYGLSLLRQDTQRRIDALCIDAGLLYLPVGAVWLLIARSGAMPFGFGEPIITLTAVHFHYAGFATPILSAMVGRKLLDVRPAAWRAYRIVVLGTIGGPPLLAIGITFSPWIEVLAALWLAASLAALALLTFVALVPRVESRLVQALLIVSCGASLTAMVLAAIYAIGEFSHSPLIDIPQMLRLHGLANALGFVLCGALAWRLMQGTAALRR